MSPLTLSFELVCTREEAARFAAVELFLDAVAQDPAAEPSAELDAFFGPDPRSAILGLVGHPQPLGITCRYDRGAGVMTLAAVDGKPSLAALPALLLWLYPDKLPMAYAVHLAARPEQAVWTIVGTQRIEIARGGSELADRLVALRAAGRAPRSPGISSMPLPEPGQD